MGISLDLYDFFAHLIPGAFFLMAFLYGFQADWLRSPEFATLNPAQLVGLGVVSYLIGYIVDPLANRWYRCFRPGSDFHMSQWAVKSLMQDYPWLKIEPQALNWYVLLAYIKRHNLPMAQEIERFNVTHIMLRGVSLGLLAFAVVFGSKVITGDQPEVFVGLSLLSTAGSYLLMQEALKFRTWFYKSIYQSALALKLEPEQLPIGYQNQRSKWREDSTIT
jgi:hypothetical protein